MRRLGRNSLTSFSGNKANFRRNFLSPSTLIRLQPICGWPPRLDGILSFLSARTIEIPLSSPSDSADATTVWGLATQKSKLFRRKLQEFGVDVDCEAVRFLRELRSFGVR